MCYTGICENEAYNGDCKLPAGSGCPNSPENMNSLEFKRTEAMTIPNPGSVTVISKGDILQKDFENFAAALQNYYGEKEVKTYFENLGYNYSWDYDNKYRWHEIIKPG
jgi:hypothetical protein